MHHYSQGLNTKQAHKAIPEGYYEEEQGRKGFFGPVSHLIRKNPDIVYELIESPNASNGVDRAIRIALGAMERLVALDKQRS